MLVLCGAISALLSAQAIPEVKLVPSPQEQAAIQVGGKTLAPGVYNVFVDLKPGNWTLVMSNQPIQETFDPNDKVRLSGATNYDPKFDLLRAPMTVRTGDSSTEQFMIGFTNVTETSATLSMAWEKTLASIDLKLAAK